MAAAAGATAMIDLSDGLSSDLAHICRAVGGGRPPGALGRPGRRPAPPWTTPCPAGDDYELCFTAPDPVRVAESFAAAGLVVPVRIGTVTAEPGIAVREAGGALRPLPPGGFEHPVP